MKIVQFFSGSESKWSLQFQRLGWGENLFDLDTLGNNLKIKKKMGEEK